MKTLRESNIELIRSIAMFMILLLHANFVALSYPSIDEIEISPITQSLRLILESLCIVSVSIFIYISGWFKIKPSIKKIYIFYSKSFSSGE